MQKTKASNIGTEEKLLVDTAGLEKMLSAGRSSALEIGMAAGARVQVGRRVFWSVEKVRKYLLTIAE